MSILDDFVTRMIRKRADLEEKREKLRMLKDDSGMSTMNALIAVVGGILVIVVMFGIVPLVGSSVDTAITIPANSGWNATENTDLITGVDLWQNNAGLISLAVTILVLSLVIGVVMYLSGRT